MCILWLMVRGPGAANSTSVSNCVMNNYKLIVAANRDEFYSRPSAPAHFWAENPHILAGRDMLEGGTWIGMTKTGKFSAITNISEAPKQPTSRGSLVFNYLNGHQSPDDYVTQLNIDKDSYTGFNLITAQIMSDGVNAVYFNNHTMARGKSLVNGIYGLSNCELDTPWVKLNIGRSRFEKTLQSSHEQSDSEVTDRLIDILHDRTRHVDDPLMAEVIKGGREGLTSTFVDIPTTYGTRSSAVLLVDLANHVTYTEYSPDGPQKDGDTGTWTKKIFHFNIDEEN